MQDCVIHWRTTPPTPAQQQAWAWLWKRLLGGQSGPERGKPQDPVEPGASTVATVSGGHNIRSNDLDYSPKAPSSR